MIKRLLKLLFKKFILTMIFLLPIISLSAQKLVISEVYWEQEEPKNNWIEICNAQNKDLELKSLS